MSVSLHESKSEAVCCICCDANAASPASTAQHSTARSLADITGHFLKLIKMFKTITQYDIFSSLNRIKPTTAGM